MCKIDHHHHHHHHRHHCTHHHQQDHQDHAAFVCNFVCNEEVSTNLLHFRSLKDGQSGIEECVNNLKLNRAGLFSFQISDSTHFSAPSLKTDICHCVSLLLSQVYEAFILSFVFQLFLTFVMTKMRQCGLYNILSTVWIFYVRSR